jgi:hypothetical protein
MSTALVMASDISRETRRWSTRIVIFAIILWRVPRHRHEHRCRPSAASVKAERWDKHPAQAASETRRDQRAKERSPPS